MNKQTKTRGERNNNWGNIRFSPNAKFKGIIGVDKDGFSIFSSTELGNRALLKVLETYFDKRKLDTIEEIIKRYAPPNENNTGAYISFVARKMGISPKQKIDLKNETTKFQLANAIVHKELGKDLLSFEKFKEAKELLGGIITERSGEFGLIVGFVLFFAGLLLSAK